MRLILPLFILTGIAIATPARAEPTEAQLWINAIAEVALTEDIDLSLDLVARASDADDGIFQTQAGTDLNVDLGRGVRVGAGYSHVINYEGGRVDTREHRVRQQVAFPIGSLAGGRLTGRLRLEQRWRSDGEDLKLRLRPRIIWSRPIGPEQLSVRIAHESFYNLNDTIGARSPATTGCATASPFAAASAR
jgi:hypothetical protein